jgi:hypothetical protein
MLGVYNMKLHCVIFIILIFVGCSGRPEKINGGFCWNSIKLDGWSEMDCKLVLGIPEMVLRSNFIKPKRTDNPCSDFDCQWVYKVNMGNKFVYIKSGNVVLLYEEWSDL